MKRAFVLLLSFVLLLCFTSCKEIQNNDEQISSDSQTTEESTQASLVNSENSESDVTADSAVTGFSDCFDQIGLYADMSQGEFTELLDKYTYQGATVSDLVVGCHEDGEYGGGWIGTGEHFEFVNYYIETDDGYSIYTNSIYTKVQLDNMPLPNGFCFGDDIETVLDKCGISLNLTRDDTSKEVISLYSDGQTTLELLLYAKQEDGYYGLGYGLQYSHGAVIGDKDERVTENIYLSFDKDNKLYSVKISVERKRKLRR